MRNNKILKWLGENFLSILIFIVISNLVFVTLYSLNSSKDFSTIYLVIDICFKLTASAFAILWLLNRYFSSRSDAKKIEIEGIVDSKEIKQGNLVNYNIKITNSGSVGIDCLKFYLEIQKIELEEKIVSYVPYYRFPTEGFQNKEIVEPNSWIALNDSILLDEKILGLRIYLKTNVDDERYWDWHKNFNI